MDKQFYSREETAKLLCVSTDTLDRLSASGKLHKTKIGTRTLYSAREISRFTDKLIREGAVRYAQ